MAYTQNNDEEEDVISQPQSTGQGGSLLSSTPGAGSSGGGAATGGATAKTPGNFVGINEYINANKGQTNKLTENVANTIGGDISQARNNIDEQAGKFNWQVGQDRHKFDGNLIDQIKSSPNPDQLESVIKASDTSYKGPENFTNTNEGISAQQGVGKAQNTVDLSKSESGLGTIMSRLNPGQQTKGVSMLDSALLKSDPNARQTIDKSRQPFSGLNDYLKNATEQSNKLVDSTKENNKKTGEMTQQFVTDWKNKNTPAPVAAPAPAPAPVQAPPPVQAPVPQQAFPVNTQQVATDVSAKIKDSLKNGLKFF